MAKTRACVTCDCNYNVLKQFVKLNQLLWNVDDYIKDAKKAGHKDCQKTLEQLKNDSAKNASRLKKLVLEKARKGKLD